MLAKQRKWDTIIRYWDELIQLEPEHAQAYLERGGAYSHQGNWDAALNDAKKSCDLGSSEGCIQYKKLKTKMLNKLKSIHESTTTHKAGGLNFRP
jgi:regulator of sirC expression with transglutaminase-like and TPR domain